MEGWKLTNIIYLSTTFLKACFSVRKMISGVVICADSWGRPDEGEEQRGPWWVKGHQIKSWNSDECEQTQLSGWDHKWDLIRVKTIISLINQSGSNQNEEIEDDLIPRDNTQTHTHTRHCDHSNTLPLQYAWVCVYWSDLSVAGNIKV